MEPEDLRDLGQEYDLAMPPARTLRALSEVISVLDNGDGTVTIVSENGVYEFAPGQGCSCPDAEHNGARCKHERTVDYRTDDQAASDLQAELGAALLDIEETIKELEADLQRLRTAMWTLERHLDTARSYPTSEPLTAVTDPSQPPASAGATDPSEAVAGD